MADYETSHNHHHHQQPVSKETAFQALNTIIQLHFEKTLEKKRAIDLQKKELHKLFQIFFIFLALLFLAQSQEPPESYFGKFKRNWALHFGFLILIYAFMISSSVVLLCF
ncbi:hypothetical protein V8G54_006750 [Vigna mungo]|uniref:Transmembrane protein n=1 Tax=Vigna mungo TaxID=3915 RepID=A0AAQ3S7N2_VIGMU